MNTEFNIPWQIDETAFPADSSDNAQMEFLVRYAVLAPSTHNSQPWMFRVRNDALELFADYSRSLPVCDPHGRERTISCGAALGFARLAARNFGRQVQIDLLPSPRNPDLLARLRFSGFAPPGPDEARWFHAIPHRHTTRTMFRADPAVEERIAHVQDMPLERGIRFAATSDPACHRKIAALVVHADRLQMSNASYRRELAKWVRSSRAARADGMSLASFGLSDLFSRGVARVMERFDIGFGTAKRYAELVTQAPSLGLLTSIEDNQLAWLQSGMALSQILLELAASNIACSFLNQPIELPELRSRVAVAFGRGGYPQMLLRLGRAEPGAPSARREPRHVIGG